MMPRLLPEDIASVVSDPMRRRIVALLSEAGTLCVCELVYAFGASQPRVSQHLAKLRAVGLVRNRRVASRSYYAIAADLPAWVQRVLHGLAEGAASSGELEGLRHRLDRMPARPPEEERPAA
jgi:ArsR family transcriptional regulator